MSDLSSNRQYLLEQLGSLNAAEERINQDLQAHFSALIGRNAGTSSSSSKMSLFDPTGTSSTIVTDLQKVERFAPIFETIHQNSSKLAAQVDDCRLLSERLSSLVRQLDLKQMRAQKALACTEDILNLKDCKFKIIAAIEEKDLSAAVGFLRQVHDIDQKAAKTSEDYEVIVQKEAEVKEMVRAEFQDAVSAADTDRVMALCPLLQTLGLEVEARDNFLVFMEKNVFIGVSADAASVEGATDPSTAYAQALSSVFNATYLIIQQYLPMVIQGLESSLGDIYFLRKLHKRCEQEAGTVLKRYMKYRGVKDVISNIKSNGVASASINQAEVHVIMDELALLIQFCCKYSKYLKHVCHGAESKVRSKLVDEHSVEFTKKDKEHAVVVFSGPQEFDRIVDELVGKYYVEGEQWLMRQGMINTLPRIIEEGTKLDECFFVLQKCGLRSIATNNIQASCAVLNYISDLISTDLLQQANQMMDFAVAKVLHSLQDHISRYRKSLIIEDPSADNASQSKGNALSKGFTNAISLASTLAGGVSSNTSATTSADVSSNAGIIFHESGGFTLAGVGNGEDPWGTSMYLEAFNIVELCSRYTDRLNKDLTLAGQTVFDDDGKSGDGGKQNNKKQSGGRGTTAGSKHSLMVAVTTSDIDKLKVCRDNFDTAKALFSNVGSAGIFLQQCFLILFLGTSARHGKSNCYNAKLNERDNSFHTGKECYIWWC
jgi:hypothetical protein